LVVGLCARGVQRSCDEEEVEEEGREDERTKERRNDVIRNT